MNITRKIMDVLEEKISPRGHSIYVHNGEAKVFVDTFEGKGSYVTALSLTNSCRHCDEYISWELDESGEGLIAKTPCQFPNGITQYIDIKVSSGKIIVGNDLRPVFDGFKEGFPSYNTSVGQAAVVKKYAAQGCAYGPVGNSCPSLYRHEDGKYSIASIYSEEADDAVEEAYGESLAWICTDLWAYHIADYAVYLERGGEPIEEQHWAGPFVIDFPNGTYRFHHHTWEKDFNHDGETTVYTTIERVGD